MRCSSGLIQCPPPLLLSPNSWKLCTLAQRNPQQRQNSLIKIQIAQFSSTIAHFINDNIFVTSMDEFLKIFVIAILNNITIKEMLSYE